MHPDVGRDVVPLDRYRPAEAPATGQGQIVVDLATDMIIGQMPLEMGGTYPSALCRRLIVFPGLGMMTGGGTYV